MDEQQLKQIEQQTEIAGSLFSRSTIRLRQTILLLIKEIRRLREEK